MRWWLDDRETAAGRPHMHLGDAKADDLAAFDQVLKEEIAQLQQANRCLSSISALGQQFMADDETVDDWLDRCEDTGDAVTAARVTGLMNEVLRIEESRTHYLGGPPLLRRRGKGTRR
jgi:hypothetical protein